MLYIEFDCLQFLLTYHGFIELIQLEASYMVVSVMYVHYLYIFKFSLSITQQQLNQFNKNVY